MDKTSNEYLETKYIKIKNQIADLNKELSELKEQMIQVSEDNDVNMFSMLTVYKIAPKATTSWARVAKDLNPPESLVRQYTTISKESYGIRVKKEDTNK